MKPKYIFLCGFGLAVILLVVSCQLEVDPTLTTAPIELMTSTVASQLSIGSITPSPLPTATAVANIERTSDLVLDPNASATVALETATTLPTLATPTIAVVTLTPLPTIEGEVLEFAVAELFVNPMNCNVPCWWGTVPNETTVFEVQQFLTLYQFTFRARYNNQIPDLIEVLVGYDKNVNQFDFRIVYIFEGIVLETILSEQSLPLFDMLNRFGQPDEVWLETISVGRDNTHPFRLNMVYLQEGMAVGYVVDASKQDDVVIGCFADEETGLLQLNTPGRSTSYNDFREIFSVDRRYLPLEEVTDLTMEDFMQRFSDPNQPHCIETPAELWE